MATLKIRAKKPGSSPGTLIYLGKRTTQKVKIEIIDYSKKKFQEKEVKKVEECFKFKETPTITWININGVHDTEIVEKIGRCYGLHHLILEDIVNTNQRPKLEDYEHYSFIILKMIYPDEEKDEIAIEQVSLILGKNFVISFQEGREGDVFEPVRQRIRKGKGRIRKMGSDYLAYALIDAVVDNYFIVLGIIGEKIAKLEDELIKRPTVKTLHSIHKLKRQLIVLRRAIWPLRDVISNLQRSESKLIKKETLLYLRDVHDHTIRVMDTIETSRDVATGMLEVYLSIVSQRMNEIMKLLTVITTIFIPLTFIVGVYGMNFRYMPEINWRYGYLYAWIILLIVGISMYFMFRRKRWV